MKLHQHFEFGPSSQDPFSFCQIQLALDTVFLVLYGKGRSRTMYEIIQYMKHETAFESFVVSR
jgi:hypothetical protein